MLEYLATKEEIEAMTRKELINYLENCRGTACFPNESTKLLRECALEEVE